MVQPRLIVRGQRHDQRPFRAQPDLHSGRLLQFGGEGGPARLAFAPERDQGILAGLGFAAGCQHPGGGMARARTRCALVEHRNRHTPRRQPPGDAEPDDAGADDGDVGLFDAAC